MIGTEDVNLYVIFPKVTKAFASLRKKAQHESCKLSFTWGKMRTIAWETAPQIPLRNCCKEIEGKVSIHGILVKGQYMQSSTSYILFCRWLLLVMRCNCHHERFQWFLDLGIYKNWAHKIAPKNIYLKTCSASFVQSTDHLISAVYPELLSGGVESQQLQQFMI